MKRRILLPGAERGGRRYEHRLRTREAPEPGFRRNTIEPGDRPLIRATVTGLTVRQGKKDEDENRVVVGGMMYRFDDVYDAGWFTESIAPGAVQSTDDVRFLIGHDHQMPALARSPQTMDVGENDDGLAFEATLDLRNPDAQRAYYAIERGDSDGMSIGFYPLEERIIRDPNGDDPTHYEVTLLHLLEGSVVNFPAYESGQVEPRDLREGDEGTRVDKGRPDDGATAGLRMIADSLLEEFPTMEAGR